MIAAVEGLVGELRRSGIPVSAADHEVALAGLRWVDLGSRAEVKAALGAALIKNAGHESAYSAIFDLFFAAAPAGAEEPAGDEDSSGRDPSAGQGTGSGEGEARTGAAGTGGGGGAADAPAGLLSRVDDDELRELLVAALRAGQQPWLRALAAEAVTRFADFEPGRSVAGVFYLYRTMRGISVESLPARLLAVAAPGLDDLGRLLLAEEYERRVAEFLREAEAEIRRRMVADRGAADVARTLRTPLPEDADFLTASAERVAELRAIVAPLARTLAARLAARQRGKRRGALDFRRTARASLSTGGVPANLVFRPPRPAKPELVILADISGSVAAFAEFTLHLTFALRTEFTRVRSFVFVDTTDEVTEILAEAPDIASATATINKRGCGVWLDGHSDYGNALRTFAERYAASLRSRTTVLVLGDGRANYHASGAATLHAIGRRAGHVYWLNPERAAAWDSGDSVISEYATCCDGVFECRNVRQLRAFIEQLLLPGHRNERVTGEGRW
ncbi:MAG TPA: VWA domain-containing protein [Trebonia sp.]|nr:VWA domain-containing protein [Trebonia sp.]